MKENTNGGISLSLFFNVRNFVTSELKVSSKLIFINTSINKVDTFFHREYRLKRYR